MFKRRQLATYTRFHQNNQGKEKRDNIIISTAFITFIGYLFTYMYELGFLLYYGIPEDFIQITIEELCKTLIAIFIVFWGCYFVFVLSFLGSNKLKKILGFLFIISVAVLLYTSKKTFNTDAFHENKSLYSLIVFGVIGVASYLFDLLGEKLRIWLKNNKLPGIKKTIPVKDSILNSIFFLLFLIFIIFFGKCIGYMSAEEKNTYSIVDINNEDYVMIKYLKDGRAIFLRVFKDRKFIQGNYRIIDLSSITTPMMEEEITLHKIKIDYQNK